MKRIFTFAVAMLLFLSVSAQQGQATVDGIVWNYEVISTTTCKVGIGDGEKNPPVSAIDQSITGSVAIPESIEGYKVVEINKSAFKGCQVSSIIVPNTVTKIGDEAFKRCHSLTTLELGSGVTSVGEDALQQCENLTDVTIFATNPPMVEDQKLFPVDTKHPENTPFNAKLHVPAGCKAAYAAAGGWKDFTQCKGIYEDASTSISSVKSAVSTVEERYTLDGRRTNGAKGINIIRMSNGNTKKVLVE